MPNQNLVPLAAQNQRIHYANCQAFIAVCRQALAAYAAPDGQPLSDRWAAQLTADGAAVVASLQTAADFLGQPALANQFTPEARALLATCVKAVDADVAIGVQVGTGGPNPWGATFPDAIISAMNYTNIGRNPYAMPDYPPL